jgi:hypothetical protein
MAAFCFLGGERLCQRRLSALGASALHDLVAFTVVAGRHRRRRGSRGDTRTIVAPRRSRCACDCSGIRAVVRGWVGMVLRPCPDRGARRVRFGARQCASRRTFAHACHSEHQPARAARARTGAPGTRPGRTARHLGAGRAKRGRYLDAVDRCPKADTGRSVHGCHRYDRLHQSARAGRAPCKRSVVVRASLFAQPRMEPRGWLRQGRRSKFSGDCQLHPV